MERERTVWDVYIRDKQGNQAPLCTCDTVNALVAVIQSLTYLDQKAPQTLILERREELVNEQP